MKRRFLLVVLCLGIPTLSLHAQSLRLQQAGSGESNLSLPLGDTLTVEIVAELGSLEVSGTSIFVSIPDGPFQVIDTAPSRGGVQPFSPGPLFASASEFANLLVPPQETPPLFAGLRLLNYAVAQGAGQEPRTGTGVVAIFRLIGVERVERVSVSIDDHPVRQTRLVLPDGVSERFFQSLEGMFVAVKAIDLKDIPDAVLLPGRIDSVQIGRLDRFVLNNRAPLDSLRWSLAGEGLDSLRVQVHPVTRRVTVTPLLGWTGKRRITWTVAETFSPITAISPPSASDFSDIVVNTPPRFQTLRDTVRFAEDQHAYQLPPLPQPSPARAFVGSDLDLLVDDPEARDIHAAFRYGLLLFRNTGGSIPSDSLSNIKAAVARGTNQLLVWSRPDFAGIDSFRVIVADEFTVGKAQGQDSLRVVVIVEEEPDPPRFVLAEKHLRIRQGGSRSFPLSAVVADIDSPLEQLQITWSPTNSSRFAIERQGDALVLRATRSAVGQALFTLTATDPAGLQASMEVTLSAQAPFPPQVSPRELKVDLKPLGPAFFAYLDKFVEDLDDPDPSLVWQPPSATGSRIAIDPFQLLSVEAPTDFVGYEGTFLRVADPDAQADSLKLRIYSSDGGPVVGGLPDLLLEPGESSSPFDLDDYFYDADDADERMSWQVTGQRQVRVDIEPTTRRVTLSLPDTARLDVESLVFQVTDPDGSSARDTLLLTVGPRRISGFELAPLPALQVSLGESKQILELSDYVRVDPGQPLPALTWSVRTLDRELHALASIVAPGGLRLFGRSQGIDSLLLVAVASSGLRQEARTLVEVVDSRLSLRLHPLPDAEFVAGHLYNWLDLDDYVVDRQAHPDTALRWDVRALTSSALLVQVQEDHSVRLSASAPGQTEIIFTATHARASARDTVRIAVLERSQGELILLPLPAVRLAPGGIDSSVHLDRHLPADLSATDTLWQVSGQNIVAAFIDSAPPHTLHLRGIRVGQDTLHFTANLGRGFQARGSLQIAVVEEVRETDFQLALVPNPLQAEFFRAYLVARRELSGLPTLWHAFGGGEQAVELQPVQTDLKKSGVLIWSGNVRLPPRASGTLLFRAAGLTPLRTPLRADASLAFARRRVGKPTVLRQQDVELVMPAESISEETPLIFLEYRVGSGVLESPERSASEGLAQAVVRLHPEDLRLTRPAYLRLPPGSPHDGLFLWDGSWRLVAPLAAGDSLAITRFGEYGILRDLTPPRLRIVELPVGPGIPFRAAFEDISGVDRERFFFTIDDVPFAAHLAEDGFLWLPTPGFSAGEHHLRLQVEDRLGNRATAEAIFSFAPAPLPVRPELAANFPNPFNPGTVIPFGLPASAAGGIPVRLAVYNIAGQLIRELLDGQMEPGRHTTFWNGRDQAGKPVAAGVYFYRLETPVGTHTRRMTLLK